MSEEEKKYTWRQFATHVEETGEAWALVDKDDMVHGTAMQHGPTGMSIGVLFTPAGINHAPHHDIDSAKRSVETGYKHELTIPQISFADHVTFWAVDAESAGMVVN